MRILVIVHCALCSMRWREEKGGVKSSSAWEFALIFTLVAIMPRTIFGINAIMVMAPDMITFASQHLLFRVTHEFIPQFHPRAHYGQNLKFLSKIIMPVQNHSILVSLIPVTEMVNIYPTIYNIRWFPGSLRQMTCRPSVWCSKHYFFL